MVDLLPVDHQGIRGGEKWRERERERERDHVCVQPTLSMASGDDGDEGHDTYHKLLYTGGTNVSPKAVVCVFRHTTIRMCD